MSDNERTDTQKTKTYAFVEHAIETVNAADQLIPEFPENGPSRLAEFRKMRDALNEWAMYLAEILRKEDWPEDTDEFEVAEDNVKRSQLS